MGIPIIGYENYSIDEFGNVYSFKTQKFLKPNITKNGYYTVQLFNNGKGKRLLIHRIVAKMFIPNPNNYQQVNHKDENKCNNHVANLEWCTPKYNMNYGIAAKTRHSKINYKKISDKMKKSQMSVGNNNATPVLQFDKSGKFIKQFDCEIDAIKELKAKSNHISEVCRGKRKSFLGYFWKYKEREVC